MEITNTKTQKNEKSEVAHRVNYEKGKTKKQKTSHAMDPIFASYLQIPTNVLLTNSLYLDIYISFRKQKNEKKKTKEK